MSLLEKIRIIAITHRIKMLRKRAAIYNAESNNLEVRSMHLHLEARYMDTLAYGLEREISTLKNRRLKPRF